MATDPETVKEKHPSWFKLKIERRQLIKQLPPETAVNVLLACWEYLETCEIPDNLQPMEKIAFSAFFPDMEEAWKRYEQRINNGSKGGQNFVTNPFRRVELKCQLSGAADHRAAIALLREKIAALPNVLATPPDRNRHPRIQPGRPSAGGAPLLPQRPLLAGVFRHQPGAA